MTFRVATVHLLVAVLLACPLMCMGQKAASLPRSARDDRSGCGCCSHSNPAGERDCPDNRDSRQANNTCLCHGAITDPHEVLPDPSREAAGVGALDAVLLQATAPAIEHRLSAERRPCHFAAADSGRELRALIASFLL